jgi:hypothetical protein
MTTPLYVPLPINKSFYDGIIEKKKVRKETARWFREKEESDTEYLDNITPSFYNMLKMSGERDCACQNAKFIAKTNLGEDGKKITYYGCSKCNGKFYKYFDYSFLALCLGMKRSGKTTSILSDAEYLHKIDPQRKIALWNCPDNLIFELHNVNWCNYFETVCERAVGIMKWNKFTPPLSKNIPPGTEMIEELDHRIRIKGKPWVRNYPYYQFNNLFFKVCNKNKSQTCEECGNCQYYKKGLDYFRKIINADEIEENDVLIMDEAIINVNAKQALSKDVRFWEKIFAVMAHKRLIFFAMFQRYAVIKSLREMADIIQYKRLPSRLIDNEREDKFMKRHSAKICKLQKDESVLVSELHFYNKIGVIYNRVPEWYTDAISTSYSCEIDFVDDRQKMVKDMELGEEIANWMLEQGIIITDTKDWKDRFPYFKWRIRNQFRDKMNNKDNAFKYAQESYFDQLNHTNRNPNELEQTNEPPPPTIDLSDGTISEMELDVFRQVCNGKSFTEFDVEPYHLSKPRISELVRNVGNYLLQKCIKNANKDMGDDVERYAKNMAWDNGGIGFRTAGSGGKRGKVPSPDNLIITKAGFIRPVQVKMRSKDVVTFEPLTFNNELMVAQRIKEIATNNSILCPHCLEKITGKQVEGGFLKPDDAYLYMTKRTNRYKINSEMIIEKIIPEDNKKSIRVNFDTRKVIRQSPNLNKMKDQKIIDFINSDKMIYDNLEDYSIIEDIKEKDIIDDEIENKELGINQIELPELDRDKLMEEDYDGNEFDIDNYDEGEDLLTKNNEEEEEEDKINY